MVSSYEEEKHESKSMNSTMSIASGHANVPETTSSASDLKKKKSYYIKYKESHEVPWRRIDWK